MGATRVFAVAGIAQDAVGERNLRRRVIFNVARCLPLHVQLMIGLDAELDEEVGNSPEHGQAVHEARLHELYETLRAHCRDGSHSDMNERRRQGADIDCQPTGCRMRPQLKDDAPIPHGDASLTHHVRRGHCQDGNCNREREHGSRCEPHDNPIHE